MTTTTDRKEKARPEKATKARRISTVIVGPVQAADTLDLIQASIRHLSESLRIASIGPDREAEKEQFLTALHRLDEARKAVRLVAAGLRRYERARAAEIAPPRQKRPN